MSDNVSHFTPNISHGDKRYSTTQLLTRPFDDQLKFDENGKIKDEFKWKVNSSTFNVQGSKFIGKDEDKFETMLFLPETEGRKGEGGLRTKGYFKFSYENLMFNDECLILNDKDGNEFKVDNSKLNNSKLDNTNTADFTPHISHLTSNNNTWYITDFYNNPIQPAPSEIQQKINDYFASINSTFNIQHSTLDNPDTSNSKFKIQHSTLDKLPLISIITVVFNGEKYLEETIQSVINQTYPNVEYIIIDGGSTDGTLDIIKKYEHAIDYWVSEPDKGIYDAMNKGIKSSLGEWLNFMNAGDSLIKNVLNNIDFNIYTNSVLIYGNKLQNDEVIYPLNIKKIEVGEIMGCHQSMFFNKVFLKGDLIYDLRFKIYGDYELVNRIYSKHKNSFAYINMCIAKFQGGGISSKVSAQKRKDKYIILYSSYGILGVLKGLFHRFVKGFI